MVKEILTTWNKMKLNNFYCVAQLFEPFCGKKVFGAAIMIGFFLLSKMTIWFSAEILKTNKNVVFLLRRVKHNLTKQITRWEIRRKRLAKALLCGTLYQNITRILPISHNQFIERDVTVGIGGSMDGQQRTVVAVTWYVLILKFGFWAGKTSKILINKH